MTTHPRTLGLMLGTLAIGSALTLIVQSVRASGIPTPGTLTYTGSLANPDGTPFTATNKNIGITAYDSATAGTIVPECTVASGPVGIALGQFQIQLPDTCSAKIQATPNLWIDVTVDGGSLGRTKLGAVPFAVEAGHALAADTAASATHATAADTAINATGDIHPTSVKVGSSGAITPNWWEFGLGDGTSGAGIDFHSGATQTDFSARIYRKPADNDDLQIANAGTGHIQFYNTSSGASQLAIGANGNVAVGGLDSSVRLAVYTATPNSTDGISVQAADSHGATLSPSLCQGCSNGITQAKDSGIIFSAGAVETGAFVIAPWANGPSGIRILGSNGNVGIGTASPAYPLDVNGAIRATNVAATSDERLKTNIRTLEHPIDDVQKLRGVRFSWKHDGKPSIGVVAQEVERVYPELVLTAPDGIKSVEYDKLTAVLIESSKALAGQNVVLQRENEELRARMERLERRFGELLGD